MSKPKMLINRVSTGVRVGIRVGVCISAVSISAHKALAQTSDPLSSPSSTTSASAPASDSSSASSAASSSGISLGGEESQLKASRSSQGFNKVFEDTAGITDTRMRAEMGSMSRFSGKFNFDYRGPEIGDPSNPYQPNPDNSPSHNPTKLSGNVAVRYRLSSETAMNFGTGVSDVTPFADNSRTDVSTPFVSIDRSYRVHQWQFSQSLNGAATTTPESMNVGQYGQVGVNFGGVRDFGHSNWHVGLSINASYGLYDRPYYAGAMIPGGGGGGAIPDDSMVMAPHHGGHGHGGAGRPVNRSGILSQGDYGAGDGNAVQFSMGVTPTVKYQITQKMGSYTSGGFTYYEPRSSLGKLWLWDRTYNQRLGLDYAFTKEIYFSPSLAFYPQSFSWASTTINFSTVFSIF